MAPSWITISNTLPGGPWKFSTSSARMMWPVEDTGKNSVRPSTTPISTVFQISVRSIGSILEALGARPAFFGHAARLGALAAPELQLACRDDAAGPRQPLLELEGLRVGQAVGLRLLQGHAAAAAHLGHLLEREDQELAPLAEGGDRIGAVGHDGEGLGLLLV